MIEKNGCGSADHRECLDYGFGLPERLDEVQLDGFTQYGATTGEKLSPKTRQRMRDAAARE